MKTLQEKIVKSRQIITEADRKWKPGNIAIAWTGGKDSTVLLHLAKSLHTKNIPYLIMFNDSTIEFPEIYEFVRKLSKEWKLNLAWVKHRKDDLEQYRLTKKKEDKMEIMRLAKIHAINDTISKYKLKAVMSGIRWDEHPARSQEKYFSPRDTHYRVHPIIHFTLDDIWSYIKSYNVPYVKLYDNGYKSLGEAPFTKPVKDADAPERAGREATKEKVMNRLRKLGYW